MDKDIFVLTGDLGYKMLDPLRENYPDRVINCMASEQSMLDISVGLAMDGRKPFVYTITPFLLWRGAETIRNYINHERVPVRLVGSGRDDSYKHDGFSHFAYDTKDLLKSFPNIQTYWPNLKEDVLEMVNEIVQNNIPSFISLCR